MITYIPHRGRGRYTPTEIKDGVKAAYYEIKKEEAEKRKKEEAEKVRKETTKKMENEFDEAFGVIIENGEEVSF